MKNYTNAIMKPEDRKQIEKIDMRFKFRSKINKHNRHFGF